jgi:hypothetical protein
MQNSPAVTIIHNFVSPIITTMIAIASIACVLFLVHGGYLYMSSNGRPQKLEHAKKILRNALIGLVIVCAAAALSTILSHAYFAPQNIAVAKIPVLTSIKPQSTSVSLTDVLIKAVAGLLQNIINSVAVPFMSALNFFTKGTPDMALNAGVFKLWLAIVAISDGLYVLVIALLGFHVMSYATFGLEEIEFKHLLPQIGGIFLLLNSSIFVIDGIISISNIMIRALDATFPTVSVWSTLSDVVAQSNKISIAALLIMIVFLVLSVILVIYYVGRLVTLYAGAVLSPMVILLWLVPGFRDFVHSAAKVYISTIFVLFIHVVILQLAASIFAGLIIAGNNHTADPIMALLVGLATITALLKTQGLMMQLSYASIGPKSARILGGQFINSVASITTRTRGVDSDYRGTALGKRASVGRPAITVTSPGTSGALTAANSMTASTLRIPNIARENEVTK